ncbi:MAG: hypothetical protein MRY83_14185, partial [Flavobacteriales bacterium]|nr:hypothetical protein [Flavobacteriales bacterium]
MKGCFAIIFCVFCYSFGFSQVEWAHTIGGTGTDVGKDLVTDISGNVIVGGHFTGTVDFDPGVGVSNLVSKGRSDIFIAK